MTGNDPGSDVLEEQRLETDLVRIDWFMSDLSGSIRQPWHRQNAASEPPFLAWLWGLETTISPFMVYAVVSLTLSGQSWGKFRHHLLSSSWALGLLTLSQKFLSYCFVKSSCKEKRARLARGEKNMANIKDLARIQIRPRHWILAKSLNYKPELAENERYHSLSRYGYNGGHTKQISGHTGKDQGPSQDQESWLNLDPG